jgi:hypothetical protein
MAIMPLKKTPSSVPAPLMLTTGAPSLGAPAADIAISWQGSLQNCTITETAYKFNP